MKRIIALAACILFALTAARAESSPYATSSAQLILRYNDIVHGSLPAITDIPKADESGTAFDATTVPLNGNCAMVLQTEKGTGRLADVMILASGSGTAASGLVIMQTMAGFVAAYGLADTLAEGLAYLVSIGMNKADAFDGSLHQHSADGVEVSYANIKGIGLMLTIAKTE